MPGQTEKVLLSIEEHVAVVTLNDPQLRNSISDPDLMSGLLKAIEAVNADVTVRVAILTGAGSSFCSGGNLRRMNKLLEQRVSVPAITPSFYRGGIQQIPLAFERSDVPFIAAINGPAIGGGTDLACMCDIRIASRSARFASNFVRLGLVPGDGGAWLLPRIVGMSKACELALTGDIIDADDALACGLVSRVVEDTELMASARDLASRIARNPAYSVRMTRRLLIEGQNLRLSSHLESVAAWQSLAHTTNEHRDALAHALKARGFGQPEASSPQGEEV